MHLPESGLNAVLRMMQLTLDTHLPNTSRCFTYGARKVCLGGENPTRCVPAWQRYEGLSTCDCGQR